MSKATIPRKPPLRKYPDRHSSTSDRASDDEPNRRRSSYQFIEKDKQYMLAAHDLRKNKNQLDILRDILSHNKEIMIPKNNMEGNGKNHSTRKARPTSARNINASTGIHWNQSDDDNLPINVTNDDVSDNEPVRLSRSNRKDNQQHSMIRSTSLYSQSNDVRSTSKAPFVSHDGKSNESEPNVHTSPAQLKQLLEHLSSELNNLESMTGFKPMKLDLSSHTCSATLATALITLTGHVKQCIPNSKDKDELNHLKDQLSFVIKTQLDFQQKIEHQMTTLQTMMQTICQLINSEIISNRKCQACTSRPDREHTDLEGTKSGQHWFNDAQRTCSMPKDTNNAMNELLLFARRMNTTTPVDANLHAAYIETLQASKNLSRPPLSMSTSGIDLSKQIPPRQNINQESRSLMITPINVPSSYDIFESSLLNGHSSINTLRNEISGNEPLLEKILHERLRLVQQMAELNKQHHVTQEELANLEEKTRQPRGTNKQVKENSV